MSRQTHIFATKEDLIPNLSLIESQRRLKYIRYDTYYSSNILTYDSLLNYKRLGVNAGRDHNSGDLFLVMDRGTILNVERTKIFLGISKYSFSQLTIPESITFQPGGLFKNKYLICGHIGTASDAEISIELFKLFSKAITKGFTKVKSYHVGDHAMELLNNGMRLITMGIDEPAEYDLKL